MTAKRGLMLVVSSPSGTGKTTLCRKLLQDEDIILSVSATTRPPRNHERDGTDYHFRSVADFRSGIDNGDFLEWAMVHGHYYGTLRAVVEKALAAGRNMVFDVDRQGAQALKQAMPEDVVSVFLLPPSMTELRKRLIGRRDTGAQDAEKRLNGAKEEIKHWRSYDYLLLNDDLERSYDKLRAIFMTAVCRREKESLRPLIDSLLQDAATD